MEGKGKEAGEPKIGAQIELLPIAPKNTPPPVNDDLSWVTSFAFFLGSFTDPLIRKQPLNAWTKYDILVINASPANLASEFGQQLQQAEVALIGRIDLMVWD
jgi:hypothetical protein